ncbi:MAG: helix-turn-helix domain-containing protein [Candidatus Geothermincolia bacterium]
MRARACLDKRFVLEALPKLTAAEIRVLLCLHLHNSVERGCWPGAKVITELTQLHRASVHAAIASLQDKRLLRVERVDGKRRYLLPVDDHNVLSVGPQVSPGDDKVSPYDDKVSPYDDKVSPGDDNESRQETTESRTPPAGARAHTLNEVTKEETKEVTPPAAIGACIHAQEEEPEKTTEAEATTISAEEKQRQMDKHNAAFLASLGPEQLKKAEKLKRERDRRGRS